MIFQQHRNFRGDEQKNPKLVDRLARILARVHAMDVPIKRTGNWLFDCFDQSLQLTKERFDIKKMIEEYDCQTFLKYDIEEELDWLKKTVLSIDSPIAFTHIDFRGSNVMVTEPDDEIILCDFEYSSYGYRGIDFGTIFAEWNGRLWSDIHKVHDFPEDPIIRPFIESYIEESIELKGKDFSEDKRNSLENILKEVKVFTLVSNMFFVVLSLRSNKSMRDPDAPYDKKSSMVNNELSMCFPIIYLDQIVFQIFCDLFYKNYQHLKQLFRNQSIF